MRYAFTTSAGRVDVVVHEEERIASLYRLGGEQRPVAAAMESWDEIDLADLLIRRLGVGPAEANDIATFVEAKHPALLARRSRVIDRLAEDEDAPDADTWPGKVEGSRRHFQTRRALRPKQGALPQRTVRPSRLERLRGIIRTHLVFGTWWLACTLGAALGIDPAFLAGGHHFSAPWNGEFALLLIAALSMGWVLSQLLFWAAEIGRSSDDS